MFRKIYVNCISREAGVGAPSRQIDAVLTSSLFSQLVPTWYLGVSPSCLSKRYKIVMQNRYDMVNPSRAVHASNYADFE